MKNCYLIVLLFMCISNVNAQVGINTNNPKSTLHVQKRTELTYADGIIPPRISGDSLRLKASAYGEAQNGAIVMVTSPVTNPNPTSEPKTQDVGSVGLFVYDAYYSHPDTTKGIWNKVPTNNDLEIFRSAYAARINRGLSLLGVNINLLSNDILLIPLPTNTNITAPSITPPYRYNRGCFRNC